MSWDYGGKDAFPYGSEETYKAMSLLSGCKRIEDWGCGTAWARRFLPEGSTYTGVDSAPGFADVLTDLVDYTSDVDGIFMRHVLEHNGDWRTILDNALASAPQLVLILFTPMSDETHVCEQRSDGFDIAFAAADIEERFASWSYEVSDYQTQTQYGVERVYDIAA